MCTSSDALLLGSSSCQAGVQFVTVLFNDASIRFGDNSHQVSGSTGGCGSVSVHFSSMRSASCGSMVG